MKTIKDNEEVLKLKKRITKLEKKLKKYKEEEKQRKLNYRDWFKTFDQECKDLEMNRANY